MRIRSALAFLAVIATAACNDNLGPQPWDATPDSVWLYSASRSDLLGQASGFDFVNLSVIRVESPGSSGAWDVALIGGAAGPLQLAPSSVFEGQTSKAGIATITGTSFADLTEAPSDTLLYSKQPVTIANGGVYAARSRSIVCGYTTSVHYAKFTVVSIDAAKGTARLAVVRNPYCGDRSFVPPKN